MSDYVNAPATKLLATHCCACRRALVDAVSVSIGMGPDCREKYGFNIEVPADARAAANALVHAVAVNPKAANLPEVCAKLTSLGFTVLASKLIGKLAKVVITERDGMFAVKTPYNASLVDAMRRVPGRRWVKEEKLNYFPAAAKAALFDLIKKFFAGEVAVGPKGVFVVGGAVAAETGPVDAQAMYDAELARLEAHASRIEAEEASREAYKAAMSDGDETYDCGRTECNGGEGCDGERTEVCEGYARGNVAGAARLVVSNFTNHVAIERERAKYRR